MARVTVEDCLENVDNRFELVLVSSRRARQIAMGKEPMVEEENDKPTVIALREIAEGFVNASILDEKEEEPVEEIMGEEMMAEEGAEVTAEAAPASETVTDDVAAAIQAALSAELGSSTSEGNE